MTQTWPAAIVWPEVVIVAMTTNEHAAPCWQVEHGDGRTEVVRARPDGADLEMLVARLPGFDAAKASRALACRHERVFRLWHRDESPSRPTVAELGARFAHLVERFGGDPRHAGAIFERLYASWSEPHRAYHDVEHLTDCLRELDLAAVLALRDVEYASDRLLELDRATADSDRAAVMPAGESTTPVDFAVVEIALWYHDAIYAPLAHDNEQRSADTLVRDADALAIDRAHAATAAALVLATRHADATASDVSPSPEAALVLDIDLSILGRDRWRFLDFDHGVAEEYAAVPAAAFRTGRARFLASMLARDTLYRTPRFRRRSEQRARAQISQLLTSPRYR